MSRVFAIFLISSGCVLAAVGLIGTILAVAQLQRWGLVPFAGFAVVEGIGVVLIAVGLSTNRRAVAARRAAEFSDGPSDLYAPNRPVTRELDGTEYTVLYTPPVKGKNGRPSCLRISAPVVAPGEFHMAPETWFDRVCKNAGLATEIQTVDETFDRECYVRSDTPTFAAAYLNDPLKRIAILDLRRLGFPEVILNEGEIAATWIGFNPSRHDKPELTADAAARIVLLARDLPADQAEFRNRVGARRKQWQVVLWLFLIAFALTIISLAVFPVISGPELLGQALFFLLPGLPIFAYFAAMMVRGTSTSHHAWRALMIGAIILFPVGSVGATALLNGVFDHSAAVAHDEVIVEKFTTKSKNTTRYHVRCSSWRGPGKTESFQISSLDYNAVVPRQSHLVVTTHTGWLGVEWMESKRVNAWPAKP